jgi:chromosome partitioning protein
MIRIVISNQRGGVTKTTTTSCLARYCAERGMRVLCIDTDPQGSLGAILGLRETGRNLHSFLIRKHAFHDCLVKAHERIDVLCSDRETVQTEAILMGETARELTFQNVFPTVDHEYDMILIDVAPSISLLQTCAMLYAQRILIPVSMDPLSLQGAAASVETARTLTNLFKVDIHPIGLLPVIVDRRLQITQVVLASLEKISATAGIPVLPSIRTDATPTKASRSKKFLFDYDPKCKAVEDYTVAFENLMSMLEGHKHGEEFQATA